MRNRSFVSFALAAAMSLIVAGCGVDSSVSPKPNALAPAQPSHSLLGTLLGSPETVIPLQRKAPLASPITVSKRIGILGGVISVPGAGLTVVVPPLAVSTATNFSVTALAGSNVAYEFAPHGTTFLVPLVATQSLVGTQAAPGGSINPLSLFAGYFPDAGDPTSITESFSLNVSVTGLAAVLTIPHFSGYIFATGRSGDE